MFDPSNADWSDYRNEVLNLGSSKSVPTADPYTTLCGYSGCYSASYWLEGASPCFHRTGDSSLGHLDPDGYDVLASLIAAAIPVNPPAAAVPSSPAADITDRTPRYTWPEDTNARWYHLQVDGGATEDSWHKADSICASNVCSVTPASPLAVGSHDWRVQGRNLRGVGGWSGALKFDVVVQLPPAAPTNLRVQ